MLPASHHSKLMVLEVEEIQQYMLDAENVWTAKQQFFMTMPLILHSADVEDAALKAAVRDQCVEAENRR